LRRDHLIWTVLTLVVVSLGLAIANSLIVGYFTGSDRLTAYEVLISISTFVLVAGLVSPARSGNQPGLLLREDDGDAGDRTERSQRSG